MGERISRVTENGEKFRRCFAASALYLAMIGSTTGCETANADNAYELPPITSDPLHSDYQIVRAQYIAGNVDGTPQLYRVFDTLPEPYSNAVAEAVDTPIVQLAVEEQLLDAFGVTESRPIVSPLLGNLVPAQDNARFEVIPSMAGRNGTKQIIVELTDGTQNPEERIFINSEVMEMTVFHEAVHAINQQWWAALRLQQPVDSEEQQLFADLDQSCMSAGMDLHETASRLLGFMGNEIPQPEYGTCATLPLSTNEFIMEQYFQCVDEGQMIQSVQNLDYTPRGGHAYENVSELASSLTTVLAFAPDYFKQCFDSQPAEDVVQIMEYIRATLAISFHFQPKLEELLRRNPVTSDVIDEILY